jgi:hypothetical protein
MFWTPPNTRHKTMTSKTKNTTQYILDTTKHKTQDDDKQNKNDDKQNKKHNAICFPVSNQTYIYIHKLSLFFSQLL